MGQLHQMEQFRKTLVSVVKLVWERLLLCYATDNSMFLWSTPYLILLGCIFTLSRHIKQLVSFISHGLKYSFEECAEHLNKSISFGLNLVKDISKSLQRHRQYIYPLLLNQFSTKVQLIIAHPFKNV